MNTRKVRSSKSFRLEPGKTVILVEDLNHKGKRRGGRRKHASDLVFCRCFACSAGLPHEKVELKRRAFRRQVRQELKKWEDGDDDPAPRFPVGYTD